MILLTNSSVDVDVTAVRVFRTNLSQVDPRRAWAFLSHDEQMRSGRYRLAVHRRRFIAARGWMREQLGATIGVDPGELDFSYGNLGKPFLADEQSPSFNLSHSGDEAALAVSWRGQVGIDLELVRPAPLDHAAAAIVLSKEELAMVADSTDRDRALLRCWVRKEAYAKAVGGGLERHLAHLTITDSGGRAMPPPGFEISDIEDRATVVASIAVERIGESGDRDVGHRSNVND